MIAAFTSPDSAPMAIDRAVLARQTRVEIAPADVQRPDRAEPRSSRRIGTIHLSRVAFDATRSLALVQGSWVCGPLCGNGATVVMERDASGRWREKAGLVDILY
jgi:hypothetical protein